MSYFKKNIKQKEIPLTLFNIGRVCTRKEAKQNQSISHLCQNQTIFIYLNLDPLNLQEWSINTDGPSLPVLTLHHTERQTTQQLFLVAFLQSWDELADEIACTGE